MADWLCCKVPSKNIVQEEDQAAIKHATLDPTSRQFLGTTAKQMEKAITFTPVGNKIQHEENSAKVLRLVGKQKICSNNAKSRPYNVKLQGARPKKQGEEQT